MHFKMRMPSPCSRSTVSQHCFCSLSKEEVSSTQKGNGCFLSQKQLYACFFQVVIKTSDYFHTIYLARLIIQPSLERVKSALAAFTGYFFTETVANSFQTLVSPLSFVFYALRPGFKAPTFTFLPFLHEGKIPNSLLT